MEDINIEFEIDSESQKKLFDMFKQESEDSYKCIQQHSGCCWQETIKNKKQHFEECWQEARENLIKVEGSPDDEFNAFIKDIFMFGCNVGWNDCYTFHKDLIQKGLNQQQINEKSKSSTPTID